METHAKTNLLVHIDKISTVAARTKLDFRRLERIRDEISEISSFLKISPVQTVIFSCLVELSLQRIVSIEALARYLFCSVLNIITRIEEIEALEKKKLVRRYQTINSKKVAYHSSCFSVPQNVIECLRTGDKTCLDIRTRFCMTDLLDRLSDMFIDREDESIPAREIIEEVEMLLSANTHHHFIKFINRNLHTILDKVIALELARSAMKDYGPVDINSFSDFITENTSQAIALQRKIKSGQNDLVRKGIAKIMDASFMDNKEIVLTEKAVDILTKDIPELCIETRKDCNYIQFNRIKEKELFFGRELSCRIEKIERILDKRNFSKYKKQMLDHKLNPGFTAIFYGSPGTGKTESVYQIARKTGRNIFTVDLSDTKSKWFGDSEKKVRQIFSDYDALINNSDVEPILFINEADGLFSRRYNNHGNASSTEQSINTMQNILLQSMETFNGILIVTTNLEKNLDSAFERRFFHKIEFQVPDKEVRYKIWKSKLPDLPDAKLAILSERFPFSGGQIDIQVSKLIMNRVLDKHMDAFSSLMESCMQEKSFTSVRRVGF